MNSPHGRNSTKTKVMAAESMRSSHWPKQPKLRKEIGILRTLVNSSLPVHHSGSCNGLSLRMSAAYLTLVNSSHLGHHSGSCNGLCLRTSVAYLTLVNSSHPGNHSGSCNVLFSQQWPGCWKSMVGGLPYQVKTVARNSSQPACALIHDIVQ